MRDFAYAHAHLARGTHQELLEISYNEVLDLLAEEDKALGKLLD